MSQAGLRALFESLGAALPLRGGEALVVEGDASHSLYLLDAGRVAAIDQSEDHAGPIGEAHQKAGEWRDIELGPGAERS